MWARMLSALWAIADEDGGSREKEPPQQLAIPGHTLTHTCLPPASLTLTYAEAAKPTAVRFWTHCPVTGPHVPSERHVDCGFSVQLPLLPQTAVHTLPTALSVPQLNTPKPESGGEPGHAGVIVMVVWSQFCRRHRNKQQLSTDAGGHMCVCVCL